MTGRAYDLSFDGINDIVKVSIPLHNHHQRRGEIRYYVATKYGDILEGILDLVNNRLQF